MLTSTTEWSPFADRRGFTRQVLGIYVECTTMKQSLTNRKNQKARNAEAQHGIVVCLLYRRDLERLSARHGLRLDKAA